MSELSMPLPLELVMLSDARKNSGIMNNPWFWLSIIFFVCIIILLVIIIISNSKHRSKIPTVRFDNLV